MNEMACPEALPSGQAAAEFVSGQWSKAPAVLGTMAIRTGIIAAALLAAGQRQRVIQQSLIGAGAIELSVLLWSAAQVEKSDGDQCYALDSGRETLALLDGAPGAVPSLASSWLGRTALLTGASLAGGDTDRALMKGAAASTAIQVAIVLWAAARTGRLAGA